MSDGNLITHHAHLAGSHTSRSRAWIASLAAGLFLALAAAGWVFHILNVRAGTTNLEVASEIPMFVVFTLLVAIGAVIALRHSDNPIGWLLLWVGNGAVFGFLSGSFAVYASRTRPEVPGEVWLGWLAEWVWSPAVIPLATFFMLLFPNGKLPSHRWRPLAWVTAVVTALTTLIVMLTGGTYEDIGTTNPLPFTLAAETGESLSGIAFLLITLCALGCVLSLVFRFRRSHGEERLQLKWITYAASFLIFSLVVDTVHSTITGVEEPPWWITLLDSTAFLLLPISAGIAILKYRLFDIDVVINRTLVYGALSALLAGLYFGSVVLLQGLLRTFGGGSQLSVAASTLAVAAAFNPLRERLQRFIDRRFYRRKYDARLTVEAFAATLRQEVSLDSMSTQLIEVVQHTLQPSKAHVWLPAVNRTAEERS